MKISQSELMHHRLQAWMREWNCSDIEYLGLRKGEYYYRIGEHEVPVSAIEGFDKVEDI